MNDELLLFNYLIAYIIGEFWSVLQMCHSLVPSPKQVFLSGEVRTWDFTSNNWISNNSVTQMWLLQVPHHESVALCGRIAFGNTDAMMIGQNSE